MPNEKEKILVSIKILSQKNFGPEKILVRKQIKVTQKILGPRKMFVKIFLVKKFGLKKILVKKKFGLTQILRLKKFCVQRKLWV